MEGDTDTVVPPFHDSRLSEVQSIRQPSRWDLVLSRMPWFIGIYFAVQIAVRVLISPSLGKDEAEQVLLTQVLAWGYGPQPPLYTWLATLFFAVVGEGIFALSLLKNALLAGAYLLTYATTLLICRDRVVSAVAAMSLLLLPQVAWESQRALTHSVLVLFAAALFAHVMLRFLREDRWWNYVLLGMAFAVGVLSKFNFPIIAVAMILAALSMPAFRAKVLDLRFLISASIAGLLLWRPLLWIFENEVVAMQSSKKLTVTRTGDLLLNYGLGIGQLLLGLFLFLAPLLLVYGILMFRAQRGRETVPGEQPFVAFLARSIIIAFAACIVMIVVFEVTQIKERWLQPLLYGAPILAAIWCSRRLAPRRLLAVAAVGTICAATVLIMVPARTILGPTFDRLNSLNGPYKKVTQQIRAAGFEKGAILANENLLGGNLRLQFPDSPVVTPESDVVSLPASGPYLLAWRIEEGDPQMPANIAQLFERETGRKLPEIKPVLLSLRVLYSDSARMEFGFALVPE